MASLNDYLLVSGLLFAIGLTGVIVRRNIITIYMCLEMMLSAANLTLVFFTITVAAAEVAVGLAIIVALFRAKQSVDVGAVEKMKG